MSFENFYKRKVEGGEAVTPFDFDRMPEQKPAAEEIKQEGQKLQQRTNWWQVPTYTDAVERQRKAAMQAAEKDVNRAKRERDAAMITDMADVLTRFFATRGADGAWMLPQQENRSAAANEAYNNALRRKDGLAVDFDGKIVQAKVQDYQNKQKQLQAEREYALAVDKAKREEAEDARKETLAQLQILLQQGKISEQAFRAKKAQVEAEYAGKVQQSIVNKNNSSGRKAEFIAYDADDKEHRFYSQKAAEQYAKRQGTWKNEEAEFVEEREQEQPYGKPVKTTTKTTKVVGGYSEKPKKEEMTMPGVKDDKKKMPGVK